MYFYIFQNARKYKEIKKKGIYPFEYIDSYKKNKWDKIIFNRQVLFYINRKQYFRRRTYKSEIHLEIIKFKILLAYPKLYLKSDVLLLSNVTENLEKYVEVIIN